ncbi:MAG: 16S rRNA (adenine(1518)-N(6)/adenine(1519)-N(6))-dimethyltransferase RsmA [Saprospiraceae bacterium]|nr:16S rRNA (adenine(1518)-N(6)/adenine(1519)-N(6))-dimethyltransferase RsmA [Saprospiraceae bacterium]
MKAKKSFGQHFLNREDIAERIALSVPEKAPVDKVLEIGPGKAMLTKYLLENWPGLFAVEADRDMVEYLARNYPDFSKRVFQGDFLKMDIGSSFPGEQVAIVGNFPYNISSQIVIKVIENRDIVPILVGMFQKEVAQRIVAGPGSKTYGVISVLTQAFFQGEYLFSVSKGSFSPPPKVESGVIRLVRKENYQLACDEGLFRKVVKQAFSQRRKMLRNTMKVWLKEEPVIQDSFFDQRPERLSVEDFVQLTQWVEETRG